MTRSIRIIFVVTAAVLASVVALVVGLARRDRAALVESFAGEHLHVLRGVARDIESDFEDIRENLEFSIRLVSRTGGALDRGGEIEALIGAVREYRMAAVIDTHGRTLMTATDPRGDPAWSAAPHEESLAAAARAAIATGGFAVSPPLQDPQLAWHRAFALPVSWRGSVPAALVLLVDLRPIFERLRGVIPPVHGAKIVLLGPYGIAAPMTDPAVQRALAGPARNAALAAVIARMRQGETSWSTLPATDAATVGFDGEAVAVLTPIRVAGVGHWSAGALLSTGQLRAQERRIALRMMIVGVSVAAAVGGSSLFAAGTLRRSAAIRERLRTAEQVAHLREKAEKILESVPVGVVALDAQDLISGLNEAARRLLAGEAIGKGIDAAFAGATPETVAALRAIVEDSRRARAVRRIVATPVAIAGAVREFTLQAVPLDHPLPDLATLLVLEDVTELRALSEQLLRAEKLATVGVLAAGFAHEVGTPLGVVRGRAERVASKLGPEHAESPNVRVMIDEIDRVARLIRQLLDFSRASPVEARPVPLDAVVRNVAELLGFEARSRGVRLRNEVGPEIPPLAADADQLKQVLVNLAMNAMHACAPGGTVALRARPDAGRGVAVLEIEDDGAGIPEDLRHRVFDPFFTTKKRGKGTGLGLTVAAQIVRKHGGEIDLASAVGRGTRVIVEWPLAAGGEETDGGAERRAHPGGR